RGAQERADCRKSAGDARRREPRPAASELGGVLGQLADAQLVQLEVPGFQPGREVLEVDAVRAPRRLGERRAAQETIYLPVDRHMRTFRDGVHSSSRKS